MNTPILLRGGGDLASGIALRLHHSGYKFVITELPRPLAVRRLVSFSEAVYEGRSSVEGVVARLANEESVHDVLDTREIPVLVDPDVKILNHTPVSVVIDARMIKSPALPLPVPIPLLIGLGPGYHAGQNCHAVIETHRGHTLGRVYYTGTTIPDSGQPDGDPRRVLRAPSDGTLITHVRIGDHVQEGQLISDIIGTNSRTEVRSPLKGVLRGLLPGGMLVNRGLKLGDVDPRDDTDICRIVSDKALAVGGAVLEILLTNQIIPKI